MPNGKMTNHDMLRQVYQAIYDEDGGLRSEFALLRKDVREIQGCLVGTLAQPGIIPRFDQHLENHKRERAKRREEWKTLIAVLTAVVAGVVSLVSWLVDFFFHR